MAGRKEMIWQNDFSLGAVRPEAEERDDSDLIAASLFEAQNTITLTTGQVERRPGMLFLDNVQSKQQFAVSLGEGRSYQLHILSNGYVLYDTDENVVASSGAINWTTLGGFLSNRPWFNPGVTPPVSFTFSDIQFWAVSSPDQGAIIIGSKFFDLHALTLSDAGVWTFGKLAYAEGANSAPQIPYIRPKGAGKMRAVSGNAPECVVTTNFDFFEAGHVGTYVRHNGTPILIIGVVGPREANGIARGTLSRTLWITVASVADFTLGDAVEHETLGGTGIVTNINTADKILTVFCLGSYKDFTGSGNLIGPNAKEVISLAEVTSNGALINLWDAQMFSRIYGFAGWGAVHKGRLYLCDYPCSPRAFAASQAGVLMNFQDGANDADAFVETIGGDFGGDLKFILSAEDLLFMTTRGLYYQPTRDGSAITPLTISPVPFSQIGVSSVIPMPMDDGAIFVDTVGQQIYAAILSGDAYRSWRAIQISAYHSHLIKSPGNIGATSFGSEFPEQFIYVVNSDGTAAVCQWDKEQNKVSWRPWVTNGEYKRIYQSAGSIYAMVDRSLGGAKICRRERFERILSVDCGAYVLVSPEFPSGGEGFFPIPASAVPAAHLSSETVQVYLEGWDFGDLLIDNQGKATEFGVPITYPSSVTRYAQIGLGYEVRCTPWSRRSIQTRSGTREVKRLIDLHITVQSTGGFKVNGADFGGYQGGNDFTVPPPMVSREFRIGISGGAAFKHIPITVDRPGPFRLLKLGYKVSV
jgi:hypothetical protein